MALPCGSVSEPPTIRFKLTLAFRGTRYHGWQRQLVVTEEGEEGDLPTVQNELRLALQRVVGHPVTVTGASRTDAGVHALGQAAMFDTIRVAIPPDRVRLAVNAKLPDDIVVHTVEPVAGDFEVIGDTIEKAYRYEIHNGELKDVFASDLAFHLPPRPAPLDVERMNEAARHLVGEHDFASFAKPGHGRETTVRTITSLAVAREGERVRIEVAGTGFLWNQVRILAGTLMRVGTGHIEADAMPEILAARDRQASGPTAPACGLYLLWVRHRNRPA